MFLVVLAIAATAFAQRTPTMGWSSWNTFALNINEELIKGQADAEATAIYADAYSKDEEFFEFWRLMQSYKETVPAFNKILSTGIEYFKYLGDKKP